MNIFNAIQLTPTGAGPVCKYCTHFNNDPADIEKAYPGLTALSSGFASVRHQDGFCNHHQFYLSALDSCMQFMPEGEQGGKSGGVGKNSEKNGGGGPLVWGCGMCR